MAAPVGHAAQTAAEQAEDPTIRYDRQTRLWGVNAQKRLMAAKVCLVNANAAGAEALKNVVLPGFKSFTILDGKTIDDVDVGTNFFVLPDSKGQSRAKVVSELLQELNPLVEGSFVAEDADELIQSPEKLPFFDQFQAVVATELSETVVRTLAKYLLEKEIPLFVIRTNGLVSWLRVQSPPMEIVEQKLDHTFPDLRLNAPWPELQAYIDRNHHRREGPIEDYSHIPYVVILAHEWQLAMQEHGGDVPRGAFMKRARTLDKSCPPLDNFTEAGTKAMLLWAVPKVPHNVQELFDSDRVNVTERSSTFWVFVRAMKDFVDANDGFLPLPGTLPDMTATNGGYLELQKIYQAKAQADREQMAALVNKHLASVGRSPITADDGELVTFCKNSREVTCLNIRSLEQEYTSTPEQGEVFNMKFLEGEQTVAWYLALRAAERFHTKHNRQPGEHDDQVESDVPLLKEELSALLGELSMPLDCVSDDVLCELTRFGGGMIHTIAAFVGGAAAQEMIKVIGGPVFLPLNNTFVYNGIESTGIQFEA